MKYYITLFLLACSVMSINAKTIHQRAIENGGNGPYKSVMTAEDKLPDYTIFRPANLKDAVLKENKKLPVILFANGGCALNSKGFYNFLSEIASHGYIVASIGGYESEDNTFGDMMNPAYVAQKKAEGLGLLKVLDYLNKENQNSKSLFYNNVDTENAAAMGQSCGGLQALALGTSGDNRIRTTVMLNSGITPAGDGLADFLEKKDLNKLQSPIAYIIGGETDIAYPNALDDFRRIGQVPVVLTNYNVGHGGTYAQPNGGTFAKMALAWLDMQLKCNNNNEKIFKNKNLNDFAGWRIENKNFDFTSKVIIMDLNGEPTQLLSADDKATYNAAGGIDVISGTKDAAVKVYLPAADINTGTAVVICAGGAMRFHSWGNDVESMARWLNERGIAAIGLKYRLNTDTAKRPAPSKNKTEKPSPLAAMRVGITDFGVIENANTNPMRDPKGLEFNDMAMQDAQKAIQLVRKNARQWRINPEKVGFLGYSAGGGVAIGATVKADSTSMPSFLATCYGPSLIDVKVPSRAPNLFIATRSEHPNVAAGLVSLYFQWKKAGANAEMYLYDDGQWGFGPDDYGTTSGTWRDSFFRWMVSNGFTREYRDAKALWK